MCTGEIIRNETTLGSFSILYQTHKTDWFLQQNIPHSPPLLVVITFHTGLIGFIVDNLRSVFQPNCSVYCAGRCCGRVRGHHSWQGTRWCSLHHGSLVCCGSPNCRGVVTFVEGAGSYGSRGRVSEYFKGGSQCSHSI